jgi:lipoate-protein ligase A
MIIFNKSYKTPEENLAIDEYLLHEVNNGNYIDGICRIWESPTIFVVLGLSKKIEIDVNNDSCKRNSIPILKRCSGGGTVLQGPGCFNYSFILPMSYAKELESLSNTTTFILQLVKKTLSKALNNIELKGISDLTINDVKFSGNAQRRLKNAILFHGTILYDFDLGLISDYLKEPPIQPEYRKNRPHRSFIQNISITKKDLTQLFLNLSTSNMPISITTIPKKYLIKYTYL